MPAILTSLTRIRQLASGRTRLTDEPPATVSQADIDAALIIAEEVEAEVKLLQFSSDEYGMIGVPLHEVRSKGRGGLMAELHYSAALSAAQSQSRFLQTKAGKSPGQVPPVPLDGIVRFQNPLVIAREILLILNAEMPWEQSTYSALTTGFNEFTDDLADMTVSMLPVIGPIYDISTGVIGYRLLDGQRLTNMERTLRVGFAGVGIALGLIAKGTRVTSATLKVIKAGRVLSLPEHQNRSFVALAMAVARLNPRQAAELATIIKAVSKGTELTAEQALKISRLFQIMNEYGVAAHWTRLGEKPANISGKIGSALILKGGLLKEGEREAIEILCKKLNNPYALVLPEMRPQEFAQGIKRQIVHMKHPDLAIGSVLADIYTPQTSNVAKIFQEISSKSTQAAMVIINLDRTPVPTTQIIAQMPRVWGKPSAWGITQVILLDSKGLFQSFKRPLSFELVDLASSTVAAVSREVLMTEWESIEASDSERSRK